jgi:hypothetical protein
MTSVSKLWSFLTRSKKTAAVGFAWKVLRWAGHASPDHAASSANPFSANPDTHSQLFGWPANWATMPEIR